MGQKLNILVRYGSDAICIRHLLVYHELLRVRLVRFDIDIPGYSAMCERKK